MHKNQHRAPHFFVAAAMFVWLSFTPVLLYAEPLRIAYTSIAMVYGPLWLTKEAGIFKKHNIDPEFIYIAGGPPSLQALIAGDVAVSFTAAGATVAANLAGSDVVLLGASIDSLPFELWSIPSIRTPEQLKGTRLGVSRIGATTDFVARYLLKKWSLQPDKDVPIFQAGSGPQVFFAIKGGAVQSGVLSTGLKPPCRSGRIFQARRRFDLGLDLSIRPLPPARRSSKPAGSGGSIHESLR
jgi:ABC-type nitrate/sulfonate/bicarbonate transport system substrate-binding protein